MVYLAAVAAGAADKPPPLVAVLELRNKLQGGSEGVDVAYLTDMVRGAILESVSGARVITRENILVLLQAQGKTLADCEAECEVDTGRRLGAEYVVTGEVLRFGTALKVNLKLHETANGQLLSTAQISGATADEIDHNSAAGVRRLVAPISSQRAPSQTVPSGAAIARPPVLAGPAVVARPAGAGGYELGARVAPFFTYSKDADIVSNEDEPRTTTVAFTGALHETDQEPVSLWLNGGAGISVIKNHDVGAWLEASQALRFPFVRDGAAQRVALELSAGGFLAIQPGGHGDRVGGLGRVMIHAYWLSAAVLVLIGPGAGVQIGPDVGLRFSF
jgi:TolB-like protein